MRSEMRAVLPAQPAQDAPQQAPQLSGLIGYHPVTIIERERKEVRAYV
jgi:hypothetical protein